MIRKIFNVDKIISAQSRQRMIQAGCHRELETNNYYGTVVYGIYTS